MAGRVPVDFQDPAFTQRRGEWSPLCAMTQNPLVDFSPVDRGDGIHRILVTMHNCSAEPVTLDQDALVWFGREMLAQYLRPDPERTNLQPLALQPRESAMSVLTWEAFNGPVDPQANQTIPRSPAAFSVSGCRRSARAR